MLINKKLFGEINKILSSADFPPELSLFLMFVAVADDLRLP